MKKNFVVSGIERERINPNGYGGNVSREGVLFTSIKAVNFVNGLETIATTEAPALVVDWEQMRVIREVLPMRYMEPPNNDKVPFLDSHSRSSLEKVKGSATDFKIQGGKLVCRVFISESEPDIRQKISEGHIDSVSVGYSTDRNYTVEIPKGASVEIDGKSYKNEFSDGYPMVVRTWWKTHELSGVPIGADKDAKFKTHPGNKHTDKKGMLLKTMATQLGIVSINGLSKHQALVKLIDARQSAARRGAYNEVDSINEQIKQLRK